MPPAAGAPMSFRTLSATLTWFRTIPTVSLDFSRGLMVGV
jgi:hypothetical protein